MYMSLLSMSLLFTARGSHLLQAPRTFFIKMKLHTSLILRMQKHNVTCVNSSGHCTLTIDSLMAIFIKYK